MPMGPNDADVWSHVDRGRGADACWLWTGATGDRGYGRVSLDGRYRYAHRVAWELERGELAPSLQLMFRCRNHSCVRPDHHTPLNRAEAGRFKAERGLMA